jgi:hypothetical protein
VRGAQDHRVVSGEPPTPADSPLRLADIQTSTFYRNLGSPAVAVGDVAPAIRLPRLDAGRRVTAETIDLREHLGTRPVALIFGSYT